MNIFDGFFSFQFIGDLDGFANICFYCRFHSFFQLLVFISCRYLSFYHVKISNNLLLKVYNLLYKPMGKFKCKEKILLRNHFCFPFHHDYRLFVSGNNDIHIGLCNIASGWIYNKFPAASADSHRSNGAVPWNIRDH